MASRNNQNRLVDKKGQDLKHSIPLLSETKLFSLRARAIEIKKPIILKESIKYKLTLYIEN